MINTLHRDKLLQHEGEQDVGYSGVNLIERSKVNMIRVKQSQYESKVVK